jgi:hypothetical protein
MKNPPTIDPVPLLSADNATNIWLRLHTTSAAFELSKDDRELYRLLTQSWIWQFKFNDFRKPKSDLSDTGEAEMPETDGDPESEEEEMPENEAPAPAMDSKTAMLLQQAIQMLHDQREGMNVLMERVTELEAKKHPR